MQQDIVKNTIRFYYTKLAHLSARLEERYRKSDIHEFRVHIKQLRALYRLLLLESPGEEAPALPPALKKMYRSLGRIRDLQQQKASVEVFARRHGTSPTYLLTQLKHQLKKQRGNKKYLLPEKYFAQHAKKTNRQLPPQLSAKTLHGLFMQKMEAIRNVVRRNQFHDDELHTTRKSIKDILYVSDICRGHLKNEHPFLPWQEAAQNKMKDLAEDLGQYNDIVNSLSWLQQTTTGYTGRHKEAILAYYRAQTREKKALRKKIIPRLQSLARRTSKTPVEQ